MALIIDPDSLSQGIENVVADLAFTASAAAVTTLAGAATLPAIAAGEFFEIRDSSTPGNNGLYIETGGAPTTSLITAAKLTGANPVNLAAESTSIFGTTGASTEKSVHFDTGAKEVWLIEQGNLDVAGVNGQPLYSFIKEEWKNDQFLKRFPFPMATIDADAGKYLWGTDGSTFSGWKMRDDTPQSVRSRKLMRLAGWSEFDITGALSRDYPAIKTLGGFEDTAADTAYYSFGTDNTDTGAAIDFDFSGPVNESILAYEDFGNPGATTAFATSNTITRTAGSFLTDGYQVGGKVNSRLAEDVGNNGSFVITAIAALTITVTGIPFTVNADDTTVQLAVDNRTVFNIRLRVRDGDVNGKTYDQSNLVAIGETTLSNRIFPFPLSNITDTNISETDANIDANAPYTAMQIRYFQTAYSKDVDSATNRNFGIVADIGTHSGVDGSITAAGTVLTTAVGGIVDDTRYEGGTLTLHDGSDEGIVFTIGSGVGDVTATTVTISAGTFTATETVSFTIQRAAPIVASKFQIFEFLQRELRRDADINALTPVVTGRTAGEIAAFEGAILRLGEKLPINPAGGGSGVIVEGFDTNDTNNLSFVDNLGLRRTFPFVAAGSLNFNAALVNDTAPEYVMYFEFTVQTAVSDGVLAAPAGRDTTLTSAGANLPVVTAGQYINIAGFTGGVGNGSNGTYVVTGTPTTSSIALTKFGVGNPVAETAVAIAVGENPIDTPDAIIVQDNSAANISGVISGAVIPFDFDYDNNVQGGRTAATNATVAIRAIGLESGQFAEARNQIVSRATGLSFTINAATERNYANP